MTRTAASPPIETPHSSIDDVIEIYKQHVDRTLLREQLGKTPDQRLRELVELERLGEELRRAGKRAFG